MTNCSRLRGLVGLLLGASASAGCGNRGIDGNGNRVDEQRETPAFSRVRSDCDLDVQVVQGDHQSLTVSIDSNLQDIVKTRVDGDTLFVDVREDIDQSVDGPHVLLSVPGLSAAKLAGAGSMTLVLDEPESPLDLYLSGSGSMRFDGATAALGAFLSGSGDIRLSGETSDIALTLSGSGSIRGRDLAASSGAIELSGSGDVSATIQDSASVSLSGSGQIDLFGGAQVDERRNTGSGDIVEH
jgi:Putative auto-transporter adhesin, head GIN domain